MQASAKVSSSLQPSSTSSSPSSARRKSRTPSPSAQTSAPYTAPRLPPKESSIRAVGGGNSNYNTGGGGGYLPIPTSSRSFSNGLIAKYTDNQLAEAVRDSVQISTKSSGRNNSSHNSDKKLPVIVGGGDDKDQFSPGHGYSRSSPDMSNIAQSKFMSNNPFDTAEERRMKSSVNGEGAGMVHPNRQKFNRALTSTTPSSASQTALLPPASPEKTGSRSRARRSLSTDSYGKEQQSMREIVAGQKKKAEDKKAGKHADVIDKWDPTGLGDSLWHHAGPYDAAAPSRNSNNQRAPMQAFQAKGSTQPSAISEKEVDDAMPPAPPRKNSSTARPQPSGTRRPSGGGLTGQYSTSMPAAGGYFPDMNQPQDDATLARMERQKEREQKRLALKAAWGIDTPEPFEDFGLSPNEGNIELADVEELAPPAQSAKPLRSPGLRLSTAPRTPPIKEGLPSPSGEQTFDLPGSKPGVKRTKSLMQKIKTMVRTRSGSVEDGAPPVPTISPGLREVPGSASERNISGASSGGSIGRRGSEERGAAYEILAPRSQSMYLERGAKPALSPNFRNQGRRGFEGDETVLEEEEDRFADADEDGDVFDVRGQQDYFGQEERLRYHDRRAGG